MQGRTFAVLALGLVLAGCSGDPLEQQLEALKGADAAGRKAAAESLASNRSQRVAQGLARALRDADEDVRCAAAKALGQQAADDAVEPLATFLGSQLPGRECAVGALGALKDARAAAPLLAAADRGDAEALAALGTLGPAGVAPLLNALRRTSDPKRAEALARALIAAGGKDTLAPLQALYLENDRQAKANAVLGLGLLGDPAALDTLKQAAEAGIGTAPLALARMGAPGLEALLARLDHPKEYQRKLAAAALAQARDAALVPPLEAALQGESAVVADASARALAEMAGWVPSTGAPSDASLQALASAALERAQERGDSRALALGVERRLREDLGEDDLIDLLEMQGDERLAGAFMRSSSERLRAAAGEWARQTKRTPCAAKVDAIDCAVAVAAAPIE